MNKLIVLIMVLFFLPSHSQKDKIIGLWEIERVMVGNKNMTPIAKWTRINNDGTFESGNGWLQNSKGKWFYDVEKRIYKTTDLLDVFDEFGGFNLFFEAEKMIWERIEEGVRVKVFLRSIKELPMATADYLEGVWELTEIIKKGSSVLKKNDINEKHKLFFRWDRVLVKFLPNERKKYGYWHIHGHRPEITFLFKKEVTEKWKIKVNSKELLMIGISNNNKNIEKKYVRKNSF